jgi:hypothetical protein
MFLHFAAGLLALASVQGKRLRQLDVSVLGDDPRTVNHLNGESFQQDALVMSNGMWWAGASYSLALYTYLFSTGYQYATFWTPSAQNASVRNAALSRRALHPNKSASPWETFTLPDYNQTSDDGHDMYVSTLVHAYGPNLELSISIGISSGDGTLHMIFDQHDSNFHYRSSVQGLTLQPASHEWSAALMSPMQDSLPGPASSLAHDPYYINITYPRFTHIPGHARWAGTSDLLLEFRVGRSGLGDDWLYRYTPHLGWDLIGRYIQGVNSE